ncbi:hypothetical protein BKA58DRAFT_185455 [Alternaria rosae]|uniref:uncharacterized protein n=1 Tax=Alternaria rosae TaxID=1187941 RepID=UPI001E8DD09A|nr:uncharacterized protein BKA58DRAFT_185455 [Alternaria rosae]KAH6867920.1 hypothetical protein BKA58DRAFT_185455 [Alternaria rosae]
MPHQCLSFRRSVQHHDSLEMEQQQSSVASSSHETGPASIRHSTAASPSRRTDASVSVESNNALSGGIQPIEPERSQESNDAHAGVHAIVPSGEPLRTSITNSVSSLNPAAPTFEPESSTLSLLNPDVAAFEPISAQGLNHSRSPNDQSTQQERSQQSTGHLTPDVVATETNEEQFQSLSLNPDFRLSSSARTSESQPSPESNDVPLDSSRATEPAIPRLSWAETTFHRVPPCGQSSRTH